MANRSRELRHLFEDTLGVPFTDGNRVDLLRNGDRIFPAMLQAIGGARETVEFLTFIYWKGDIARRFAHALAERARAGVRVRVLLDSFGAQPMAEELCDTMTDAGCDLRWFRPIVDWRVWQTTHRTHRKVLVVDGEVGFTGGVGIASEWEGDARDETEWRDNHYRVFGPAVHGLRGGFRNNWAETLGRLDHPVEACELGPAGPAAVQVLRSAASTGGWSEIATLMELLVACARERLRIATAYFVPDDVAADGLTDAVARGVNVEVMMPGPHTDQRVSQLAGEDMFRRLLDGGVSLWTYQPTMLHAKTIIVDDELVCIGSANYNQRSLHADDELSLVVQDDALTAALINDFEADLRRCERITPASWKERGVMQRIQEALARQIKPQL